MLNHAPKIDEDNILHEYVVEDKFNQHPLLQEGAQGEQDKRMMELAYQFNQFDLKYILG